MTERTEPAWRDGFMHGVLWMLCLRSDRPGAGKEADRLQAEYLDMHPTAQDGE